MPPWTRPRRTSLFPKSPKSGVLRTDGRRHSSRGRTVTPIRAEHVRMARGTQTAHEYMPVLDTGRDELITRCPTGVKEPVIFPADRRKGGHGRIVRRSVRFTV